MRRLDGIWLGRRAYEPVHGFQEQLFAARREGRVGDTVVFVEHDPVVTFGRGGKAEHLLRDEVELRAAGASVVHTGRGGDLTVHAPGQLVCYPILDLSPDRRDVRRYVRDLSETMRRVLAEYGVEAGAIERHIGLWVDRESPGYWPGEDHALDPAKIGAIGVKISRWITMHGFALNLTTDLSWFASIVPCGIREHGVTSLLELSDAAPSLREAAERALEHLAQVLGAESGGLRDHAGELSNPDAHGSVAAFG